MSCHGELRDRFRDVSDEFVGHNSRCRSTRGESKYWSSFAWLVERDGLCVITAGGRFESTVNVAGCRYSKFLLTRGVKAMPRTNRYLFFIDGRLGFCFYKRKRIERVGDEIIGPCGNLQSGTTAGFGCRAQTYPPDPEAFDFAAETTWRLGARGGSSREPLNSGEILPAFKLRSPAR